MHPFLTRLGIRPEVAECFRPFYSSDDAGNLIFDYGDGQEHYGFAFHHIPVSDNFWMAGNLELPQARRVILCASALDAVSWLNKKAASLSGMDNLFFLSLGAAVRQSHLRWINKNLIGKSCTLVFGNDLLGRIADVKVAAAIRRQPLQVYLNGNGQVMVRFRARTFCFSQYSFSLNGFEKASGYRFGTCTDKPKYHLTFFDELKAEAFNNF